MCNIIEFVQQYCLNIIRLHIIPTIAKLFILVLVLCTITPLSLWDSFGLVHAEETESKLVAVLDFTGENIPTQVLRSCTDAAREGALDMLPPSKFKLMTRETTRAILSDNRIDISCVEGKCEAETLRNILADYGITGSVNEIAGQYELVMRLFESKSASLLASETHRYSSIPDMLDDAKHTAKVLVANIPGAGLGSGVTLSNVIVRNTEVYKGEDIVNKETGKSGFLYITSTPEGANIYINGKSYGTAPVQRSMPEGQYVVLADMGQIYHQATSEKITVSDGQTIQVPLVLKPSFGSVTIESQPSGAKVLLSGDNVGVTPLTIKQQPSGIYNIQISKDLYFTHEERIIVEDEKALKISIPLQKSVSDLHIESKPVGASIWINGSPTGEVTPFVFSNKNPGTYQIRLVKDKYKTYDTEIVVKPGQNAHIAPDMNSNYGHVQISSNPPNASILFNGVDQGYKTPHTFKDIPAGIGTIELQKDGYGVEKDRFDIPDDGSTVKIHKDLQAKLGTLILTSTDPNGKPCLGDVLLDGEKIGNTPIKTQLVAVEHKLVVDCNGMKGVQQIKVKHNESMELNIQVQTFSLAEIKRSKQSVARRTALDIGLLSLSGGLLAFANYNYTLMNNSFNEANSISSPQDADLYALNIANGQNHLQQTNQSLIAGGVVLGVTTVHYLWRTRSSKQELREMKRIRSQSQ